MKQIIILDTLRGPGGDLSIHYAFWFAVPAARRVPLPVNTSGIYSVFRNATAPEQADLQTGAVYEESYENQVPAGWSGAQIRAFLESKYAARLAELAALPNPNTYYGTFWDGTNWTVA